MDGKATTDHLLHRISALEEELSTGRSRIQVSQLIDFFPDATFAIDTRGTVTLWNKAMEELTGVQSRDMLGKGDREHALCFYGTKRHMLVDLILTPDEAAEEDYSFIHKEGDVLIAESFVTVGNTAMHLWGKACPISDPEGNIIGAVETIRDISALKKAQEKIEASEKRYRDIFENVSDFLYLHDLNGTFIESNLAMKLDEYGYTKEDLATCSIQDMIPDQFKFRFKEYLSRVIMNGNDEGIMHIQAKDGAVRTIEYRNSLVYDASGIATAIRGSARDITERIQAEKRRKIYEERLNRAQKMEAIGTLAGGIAHDFNNILSVIIGYTELAMDYLPGQGPLKEHLHEVLKAGDRARDLVRQILTFSRQAETEPRPVILHLIIKETLKLLRSSIPGTIEIVQDIDSSSGTVLADPTHIHQVIMNLCTNAYQAMADKGGEMKVSLMPVTLDQDRAQSLPTLNAGPYIKLSVRDTGCGMDESILERIFDPFFTTKEIGRGTGLGLASVHGIVTDLDGEIIASSIPGEGSTFDVYLPRIVEDTDDLSPTAADSRRGHGEHILLVDDEEAILQIGKTTLEHLGYVVSITSSSKEALEMFTADPGRFDLVITDQTMPFMKGDQLAYEMRKVCASLPVILITGCSDIIAEQDPGIEGIGPLIEKPFSRHTLADAVLKELQKT